MKNKISQSQSNTGSMEGGQQQSVGDKNQLTMQVNSGPSPDEQSLTQSDVMKLLTKIEEIICVTTLPEDVKDEVKDYLSAAKRATAKDQPKKDVAIVNLKSMAETLEDAGKTIDASNSLLERVKPILEKVAVWFGIAAKALF